MTDLEHEQRAGPRMLVWALVYSLAIAVLAFDLVMR